MNRRPAFAHLRLEQGISVMRLLVGCAMAFMVSLLIVRSVFGHRHIHRHFLSTSQEDESLPMPRGYWDRG